MPSQLRIRDSKSAYPPPVAHIPLVDMFDSPYQYNPLPSPSSIRLIELLPRTASPWRNLPCYNLHVFEYDQAPPYHALSYTWGHAYINVDSRCDGHVFKIRPHLRDALLRIRLSDRSTYLWADAICIDQHNVRERGHQVGIMRQIYQHAKQVIVWLGKDDEGKAERAAAVIKSLATSCSGDNLEKLTKLDDLYLLTARKPSTLPQHAVKSWEALQWLLSRSWFSRLWVLQEVTANRNVSVVCGPVTMDWHHVAFAATYLQTYPVAFAALPKSLAHNAYLMRNRSGHDQWSILDTLNVARSFSMTDRRDLLYALLGFPAFLKAKFRIVPDYTKTLSAILVEIVNLAIEALGNLDVLSYVYHPSTGSMIDERFPTWAARWEQSPEAIANTRIASAGGESSVKLLKRPTYRSLTLSGFRFDSISAFITSGDTTGWFTKGDNAIASEAQYFLSTHPLNPRLIKNFSSSERLYLKKTGESLSTVFGLSLTGGLLIDGQPAKEDMSSFKDDSVSYMDSIFPQHTGLYPPDSNPQSSVKPLNASAERFRFSVERMAKNRVLIQTEKGYIGLGPAIAQLGDIVCLLHGGNVPYVLHPMDGYYQLVGECYVHGIMDGEAVKEWKGGGGVEESFELR